MSKLLKKAFRKIPHYQYNDILLETNDDITQIDHVVISSNGVFVVETKNVEGWIFGNEHHKTWTQSLYGNNYKFVNPIRQNYKHIKILERILALDIKKFQLIIVFTEYGEFKTDLPDNVLYSFELVKYLRSHNYIHIDLNTLGSLATTLEESILENTKKNIRRHKNHVRNIKNSKFLSFWI